MNLADPIRALARRTPGAAALLDGGRTITRAALDAAAGAAASGLTAAGLARGDVVGMVAGTTPALDIAVTLALARLGVAQVPLRATDPPARVSAVARTLGATALVSEGAAGDDGLPVIRSTRAWLDGTGDASPVADADDLPWVIAHSSGTTGPAKAIAVTHAMEAARSRRDGVAFRHAPEERFLTLIGPGFYNSVSAKMRCLAHGGTIVLTPRAVTFDELLAAIDRFDVRFLQLTPSHLHPLVDALPPGGPRLPSLRVLRVSSAALPPALLARTRERLSDRVHVTYGTNEAGTLAVATPELLAAMPSAVGRPLPGIELEIVGPNGSAAAVGEVRVRGPGVMDAYLDDPEATRHHCRDGWFHPGDVAEQTRDGLLVLKGRTDRLMNIGGVLTAAEEIEAVVASHPGVVGAAAVPVPSERYQALPAVAVVLRPECGLRDVLEHARRTLVGHPIALYEVRAIPRTAIGKVDYLAVRRMIDVRRRKEKPPSPESSS